MVLFSFSLLLLGVVTVSGQSEVRGLAGGVDSFLVSLNASLYNVTSSDSSHDVILVRENVNASRFVQSGTDVFAMDHALGLVKFDLAANENVVVAGHENTSISAENVMSFCVADFDSNGKSDVAFVYAAGESNVTVTLALFSDSLTQPQLQSVGTVTASTNAVDRGKCLLTCALLDEGPTVDLVLAAGRTFFVFLNHGGVEPFGSSPTHQSTALAPVNSFVNVVRVADWQGDGPPFDLLFGMDDYFLAFLRGHGNASFTAFDSMTLSSAPPSFANGIINLHILAAKNDTNKVVLVRRTSVSLWQPSSSRPVWFVDLPLNFGLIVQSDIVSSQTSNTIIEATLVVLTDRQQLLGFVLSQAQPKPELLISFADPVMALTTTSTYTASSMIELSSLTQGTSVSALDQSESAMSSLSPEVVPPPGSPDFVDSPLFIVLTGSGGAVCAVLLLIAACLLRSRRHKRSQPGRSFGAVGYDAPGGGAGGRTSFRRSSSGGVHRRRSAGNAPGGRGSVHMRRSRHSRMFPPPGNSGFAAAPLSIPRAARIPAPIAPMDQHYQAAPARASAGPAVSMGRPVANTQLPPPPPPPVSAIPPPSGQYVNVPTSSPSLPTAPRPPGMGQMGQQQYASTLPVPGLVQLQDDNWRQPPFYQASVTRADAEQMLRRPDVQPRVAIARPSSAGVHTVVLSYYHDQLALRNGSVTHCKVDFLPNGQFQFPGPSGPITASSMEEILSYLQLTKYF